MKRASLLLLALAAIAALLLPRHAGAAESSLMEIDEDRAKACTLVGLIRANEIEGAKLQPKEAAFKRTKKLGGTNTLFVAPAGDDAKDPKRIAAKAYRCPPPVVLEADEKMVEGCQFLGTVTGQSVMWGGMANQLTTKEVKADIVRQAGKIGATHFVFTSLESGAGRFAGSATARAYRCEKKAAGG